MKRYIGVLLVIVVLGLTLFTTQVVATEARHPALQQQTASFCIEGDCPPVAARQWQ